MKRSEMIELMWAFIQSVEDDYDRYMDKESVGELLAEVEKAGMLPPFVDQAVVGDKDHYTLHVDQAVYPGLCEWEPEDVDNSETT